MIFLSTNIYKYCFASSQSDQVNFDTFYQWVRTHPDATIITKWLLMEQSAISLSNDMETPTFYQTLAGVTHCELLYGNYIKCFYAYLIIHVSQQAVI